MSSHVILQWYTPLPFQPRPLPAGQSHRALELADVLVEIFSHVRTPHELLQYRLVCQNWNHAVVHTLVTKRKNSFPLRLRYGPLLLPLIQPDAALRLTSEILESPAMTLTGTTIPLSFDTVVVDHDFYLAAVNLQWQQFLSIHGESIRHLKFNIRSGKTPEYLVDCAQVVSMENLSAAFSALPNLECLDFSIRFIYYKTHESSYGGEQRMFPGVRNVRDLPQMARLTKITIQEPHGVQYLRCFLIEILAMAPNLTTLYIKYSRNLSKFASALRSLPHLNNSLTTLGITALDRSAPFINFDIQESDFSRFHLTKLELNCISGNTRHLEEFLQSQSSTLTSLILGDRVTPKLEPGSYQGRLRTVCLMYGGRRKQCEPLYGNPLSLPPRMNSLKILELNLCKFNVEPITNYQIQFPVLEELTFIICGGEECFWTYEQLHHVLLGEIGPSNSVKKFSLFGAMLGVDRDIITAAVRSTFPFAEFVECYFRL